MIKTRMIWLLLIFLLFSGSVTAQESINIDADSVKRVKKSLMDSQFQRVPVAENVFVPKGQWVFGGTISYSEHSNDNYKLLIIDGWDSNGYSFSPKLLAGYAIADNMVIGVNVSYDRTLLKIDELNISLSDDLSLGLDEYYTLRQTFNCAVFMRNYLSLFGSRRFGLFNDLQLSYGGGRGKMSSGTGDDLVGTYEEIKEFEIGIAPGLAVFATDNVALECSVGVLGFSSSWVKQITNQVEEGYSNSNSGSFKINIFSIKLGITFYFNNKKFLKN